jgi:hypothetical protein
MALKVDLRQSRRIIIISDANDVVEYLMSMSRLTESWIER